MGTFTPYAASGLWLSMGKIAEDFPQNQSDGEGSTSSLDLNDDDSLNKSSYRCRWMGCSQWFDNLDLLASHVTRDHATCGQGGFFYCGWEGCTRGDRGFNARYKMLVHVRTHTNEKPHRCCKCEKSFSRAENLKIHARSHTGERPYVCPVPGCAKAYSNSSDRFKHTRTHSIDKPYMCKVPGCPKRYTDPSSLRKHVKTYRHFPTFSEHEPQVHSVNSQYNEADSINYFPATEKYGSSENGELYNQSKDSSPSLESNVSSDPIFMDTTPPEKCQIQCNSELPLHTNLTQHLQMPRPEYGFYCSWLSLWKCPESNNQEQDLPLDLTVNRTTSRT